MTIAQTKTDLEILGTPDNSFGYLIWATNDSTYRYASLEILKVDLSVSPNSSSGINNPQVVKKMEVYGKNYSKIPFEIWRDAPSNIQYSIAINTFGGVGIATDTIPMVCAGCDGADLICSWPCEGPNYSYQIDEKYLDWSGTYTFSVQRHYSDINIDGLMVPYYQYFGQDEFAYYTGMVGTVDGQYRTGYGNPDFHEVPAWNSDYYSYDGDGFPVLAQELDIVKFDNTSTFRDKTGAVILGQYVYGVQKGLGNWRSSLNGSGHQTMVEGSNVDRCNPSNNLSTLQDFINAEAHPLHDLTCEPNIGGESIGASSGGVDCNWEPVEADNIAFWIHEDNDGTNIYIHYDEVYTYIGFTTKDCVDNTDEEIPSDDHVHNYFYMRNLQLLSITSFNNGVDNILTTSGSKLFNPDGSPNVPSIIFEKGLYKIAVKYPGSPLKYVFIEITEAGTLTAAHKDFFNANIFPNPIGGQSEYSIDMTTSARLKMTYEILDHNGNTIDKYDFDLETGHNKTHIFPTLALDKNGLTLHKFTFGDGSFKTYTTLNQ